MKLRHTKKIQPLRKLPAQEMARAIQRLNGFLAFIGLLSEMQADLSVPHIRRY